MNHPRLFAGIAFLLAIGPSAVAAGTMRCGENIVQRGFTFFEVLERCGKPDLEYDWDHRYVPGVEARVTEWVYELGTNKFRSGQSPRQASIPSIEQSGPAPSLRLEIRHPSP